MRSPTLLWSLLAAALLGSGPAASQPAQPSSTNYTIEEQEGDDGKPVGRRLHPDDADLGVENTDNVPKVARVEDDDPFFMSDDDDGKKLPPLPPARTSSPAWQAATGLPAPSSTRSRPRSSLLRGVFLARPRHDGGVALRCAGRTTK